MNTLTLAMLNGDLEIRQDELASITDAGLMEFGISREELSRLFAEGVKLMQKQKKILQNPEEALKGVRPLAYETREPGKWEVAIVRRAA